MGRAAVEHAAAFSWDHTVDALLASYRRAIGDFTARRAVRGLPSRGGRQSGAAVAPQGVGVMRARTAGSRRDEYRTSSS